MKKFSVKFNRTVESLETCEVTVQANTMEEALERFNANNWHTFLVTSKDNKLMGDNFIQKFEEIEAA